MKTIKFANGAKFEFIDDPDATPIRGLDYGWWYEAMNKGQSQALDYLRIAIMRCKSEKIHKSKLASEIVKILKEIYNGR
jgi:hypothetical protein